ncbi:hypothetical protein RCL_jg3184.t1 [Rhizophagus clarus]|nr:hypothetical protein RCL_jg3184.t1 [Rhizophagus clarus]
MDLDKLSPDQHQSSTLNPHTNTDMSTTLKDKSKEQAHTTAHFTTASSPLLQSNPVLTSSKSSTSTLTPAGNEKRIKTQDNKASHVITGYQAPSGYTIVYNILIYNIPAKWDNYILLSHLFT